MRKNREGVLILTGFLLAERARAGHDLQNPKVISAVVDAAECAVDEIERRIDAADEAEAAKPITAETGGGAPPPPKP